MQAAGFRRLVWTLGLCFDLGFVVVTAMWSWPVKIVFYGFQTDPGIRNFFWCRPGLKMTRLHCNLGTQDFLVANLVGKRQDYSCNLSGHSRRPHPRHFCRPNGHCKYRKTMHCSLTYLLTYIHTYLLTYF